MDNLLPEEHVDEDPQTPHIAGSAGVTAPHHLFSTRYQAGAEDFKIGVAHVALTFCSRTKCAPPIFRLLNVALKKFRSS